MGDTAQRSRLIGSFGETGSVVHRVDGDRHGADVRNHRVVIGEEGEAGRSTEVRIGRVAEGTRRIVGDRDTAVSVRRAEEAVGQNRTVEVRGHECACRRCVFVGRQAAVTRDHDVAHRVDGDRHGADVRIQRAVTGEECEAGRATEVLIRRVAEGTGRRVGDRDDAMSVRRADEAEGQSRAVDVRGQECACRRRVFVRRQAAVARDRSIVHSTDGDRHGAVVGNERTVAGREREVA